MFDEKSIYVEILNIKKRLTIGLWVVWGRYSVFNMHVGEYSLGYSITDSVPWSDMITSGQPYRVKMRYNSLAIVDAFLSLIGISSGHFVKKSHTVRMYL